MSTGLLLQYFVIGLAVLASAVHVASSRFPAGVRRLRVSMALPLLREGRSSWLRALGRGIAPVPSAMANNGCGGCNSCSSGTTRAPE
ncbi:MAG: DUF6587 family protein [Luteimonas sp.]